LPSGETLGKAYAFPGSFNRSSPPPLLSSVARVRCADAAAEIEPGT
jgi:hypothetical protein